MNLIVKQTNAFLKSVKKLSKQHKKELDAAIKIIVQNPLAGDRKKGDLAFLRVYKFKINKQRILLGYHYQDDILTLTLLQLGSHENFYRDLKAQLN